MLGDAQAGARQRRVAELPGPRQRQHGPLPDGVPPITNMYLWQPLAGAFYSPCVDGDYDMAVIGHEYGHMIENRMIGKGGTRAGHHAGAMGESNGDLNGVEILNEYGFVPVAGENRFAVGAYATGNKRTAIRNFADELPVTGCVPGAGSESRDRPAQLQRHRLRHHARPGARRRRDLERDELRHPPGAGHQVQRRLPGVQRRPPARLRQRHQPAEPVPGQPALGAAHVRRVPADAGRAEHARRARRVPRRRPDALRRRQPARALGSVREAWLRRGRVQHEQQHRRERHRSEARLRFARAQ